MNQFFEAMTLQVEPETMPGSSELEQPHIYTSRGNLSNPFLVEFVKDDPRNPMNWSRGRKWFITTIVTLSVFAITFTSSAYSESSNEIIQAFNISTEVFNVGVSLFVLGFAIGPAVWGPLVSEPFYFDSTDPRSQAARISRLIYYPMFMDYLA